MPEGTVFTGEGKASDFLQKEPYRNFIEEELGFEAYPGTLNLKIEPWEAEELKDHTEKSVMKSTEYQGERLGGIKLFRVKIEGFDAAIVQPELSRYSKDVIEIVAENNLRKELELEDGDTVELETGFR